MTTQIELTRQVKGALPPANAGVPPGGAAGQVLTKVDAAPFNTQWTTPAPPGVGTVTSVNVSGGGTGLTTTGGPVTNAGTITLGGTLNAASGGTGQTVYVIGDLLVASATNALSRLADVATGNVLLSGGVGLVPGWGKVNLTGHVAGVLPPANGGTGIGASLTLNFMVKGGPAGALASSTMLYDTGAAIGIGGITAPDGRLHVKTPDAINVLLLEGDSAKLRFYHDAGGTNIWSLNAAFTASLAINYIASFHAFSIGGVGEIMRVAANGNVGIGAGAAPFAKLHVTGAASSNPIIALVDLAGVSVLLQSANTSDGRAGTSSNHPFTIFANNTLFLRLAAAGTAFFPMFDGAMDLGGTVNRFKTVFATTGAINTSDAREKSALVPLTPAELAAAKTIAQGIGTYRWLNPDIDNDLHVGVTAQAVIAAMEAQGLDALTYGMVHYDEWEADPGSPEIGAQDAVIDAETGDIIKEAVSAVVGAPARDAGSRYSVRYDEIAMFIAAAQEQRLAALEAL